MKHDETVNILSEWPAEILDALVAMLEDSGIVTDEDRTGLSSVMIKGWESRCDAVLVGRGYSGGPLAKMGKYYPWAGAIYCVYDSTRMSPDDALEHLDQASKKHPDWLAEP
ncbi:hypothetical protein C7S18_23730 (plasmid) [Ahniella affigens]|uniref:Uncharacterized protein n=1 Tax=Ahniella affigens TaxID=2021234 RepID=A0A2P1PZN7_9GAMM|nr:hypothetical protein [Ahniella affigens]AVQ00311.1 hypothetical protein C7S18_23730 [Ahniella affigens]